MARNFMHFSEAGVSLAVDNSKRGQARISVAIVNRDEGDRFCRKTARALLNARLDGNNQTLKAFRVNQRLFTMPFDGGQTVNDVLRPLAERLGEQLELRKDGEGSPDRILRIISRECTLRRVESRQDLACPAMAAEE